MAQMRACTMFGILALLAGASCFRGEPDAPLTAETFVGTYIYYAADKTEPHDPDELTLRADGTYMLIREPSGLPRATEEGRWKLVVDSYGPEILFARRGYPVRIKGRSIRLVISDDRSHWYQKIE